MQRGENFGLRRRHTRTSWRAHRLGCASLIRSEQPPPSRHIGFLTHPYLHRTIDQAAKPNNLATRLFVLPSAKSEALLIVNLFLFFLTRMLWQRTAALGVPTPRHNERSST